MYGQISLPDFLHQTGTEKESMEFIWLSAMSGRTFYPRRKQKLPDVETEKSSREQDEGKDCAPQLSHCPACNQEYDIVLILPCSHTMCSHCIAAGERKSSGQPNHRSAGIPVCSVLCPGCRHPVELPCWNWSSATSCLPRHPTLAPACVSRETGARGGASEVHLQHVQVRDPN